MKLKVITALIIISILAFISGCETLQKIDLPLEKTEETKEEIQVEEPPAEEEIVSEPETEETATEETTPTEETEEVVPEEISEETEQTSKITTTVTVIPKTVSPSDTVTVKVIPNNEYGYKTTIKIYDVNSENEKRVKQAYISGCGNICKKEKLTTFKTEYDWKGSYCARVIDVETSKEVGDCFKVG